MGIEDNLCQCSQFTCISVVDIGNSSGTMMTSHKSEMTVD